MVDTRGLKVYRLKKVKTWKQSLKSIYSTLLGSRDFLTFTLFFGLRLNQLFVPNSTTTPYIS